MKEILDKYSSFDDCVLDDDIQEYENEWEKEIDYTNGMSTNGY